jgi:hypothetical protein
MVNPEIAAVIFAALPVLLGIFLEGFPSNLQLMGVV